MYLKHWQDKKKLVWNKICKKRYKIATEKQNNFIISSTEQITALKLYFSDPSLQFDVLYIYFLFQTINCARSISLKYKSLLAVSDCKNMGIYLYWRIFLPWFCQHNHSLEGYRDQWTPPGTSRTLPTPCPGRTPWSASYAPH